MRLIGRGKLLALCEQNGAAAQWISNWIAAVGEAHWKRPADVAKQFPRAIQQDEKTFLFPVGPRLAEVHLLIAFAYGVALITTIRMLNAANED